MCSTCICFLSACSPSRHHFLFVVCWCRLNHCSGVSIAGMCSGCIIICSFRCLCYPISPVGFLCQCSHFPATQGSSASCHCFLFLGCCCKSRVNCCSGVPVAGCCSMVHVGHCCESDVDKVPVVGIFWMCGIHKHMFLGTYGYRTNTGEWLMSMYTHIYQFPPHVGHCHYWTWYFVEEVQWLSRLVHLHVHHHPNASLWQILLNMY